MKMTQTIKLSAVSILAIGVGCFIPMSAWALPGQSMSQAMKFAASRPLWRGYKIGRDKETRSDQTLSKPFQGGELRFAIYPSSITRPLSSRSKSESLEIRAVRSRLDFVRDEGKGLALIRQAFGDRVAQDFAASRYTDKIMNPFYKTPELFYKGKRYGYVVGQNSYSPYYDGDSNVERFTIYSLSTWKKVRNGSRYCSTRPHERQCAPI
ncbi:hypothetical protein IQ266_07550 [filamentous cyanobacterium LEGE 11480]|uniref:Uncharacterized protein n=1 Tax=Romeriopsis navalis LEGE 11480 TaxID=2777977 RepID=A0A928Z306_9CYAN|nr:hypothetical protein [Romeriopsis navalis]MBE9029582.1 hypothetical protein [Romeriopsis navalis LEGE 11480]